MPPSRCSLRSVRRTSREQGRGDGRVSRRYHGFGLDSYSLAGANGLASGNPLAAQSTATDTTWGFYLLVSLHLTLLSERRARREWHAPCTRRDQLPESGVRRDQGFPHEIQNDDGHR